MFALIRKIADLLTLPLLQGRQASSNVLAIAPKVVVEKNAVLEGFAARIPVNRQELTTALLSGNREKIVGAAIALKESLPLALTTEPTDHWADWQLFQDVLEEFLTGSPVIPAELQSCINTIAHYRREVLRVPSH